MRSTCLARTADHRDPFRATASQSCHLLNAGGPRVIKKATSLMKQIIVSDVRRPLKRAHNSSLVAAGNANVRSSRIVPSINNTALCKVVIGAAQSALLIGHPAMPEHLSAAVFERN